MLRSISKTVFIEAPPAMVWSALTDGAELSRWFPAEARVTPGVGGTIWLSWGGEQQGLAPITAWDPPNWLQWTEDRSPDRHTVDFHLEWRTGCTVIRVVHAGFGPEALWDVEYGLANGGWAYFLQHLKWYVERHRGIPRQLISWRTPSRLPRREAFARLLGRSGLSIGDGFARVEVGDVYKTTTAAGDELSGIVVSLDRRTCQIGLTVAEFRDAMLFIEVEPDPSGSLAGFWLSTYGLSQERVAQIRARYRRLYDSALGPSGG